MGTCVCTYTYTFFEKAYRTFRGTELFKKKKEISFTLIVNIQSMKKKDIQVQLHLFIFLATEMRQEDFQVSWSVQKKNQLCLKEVKWFLNTSVITIALVGLAAVRESLNPEMEFGPMTYLFSHRWLTSAHTVSWPMLYPTLSYWIICSSSSQKTRLSLQEAFPDCLLPKLSVLLHPPCILPAIYINRKCQALETETF